MSSKFKSTVEIKLFIIKSIIKNTSTPPRKTTIKKNSTIVLNVPKTIDAVT